VPPDRNPSGRCPITKRSKALLWIAFVVFDVAVALFVWSRTESWPWREPEPKRWVYDDGPVFPPVGRR
jgi:hypothetical protein